MERIAILEKQIKIQKEEIDKLKNLHKEFKTEMEGNLWIKKLPKSILTLFLSINIKFSEFLAQIMFANQDTCFRYYDGLKNFSPFALENEEVIVSIFKKKFYTFIIPSRM